MMQQTSCFSWMSLFDLYGAQPNLFVFGRQKYSSIVGLFCTIIAAFLTIGYLFSQIEELMAKSLPQTVQSDHQVLETSAFPLTNQNFTLAVSVGDISQNPLKTINSHFTITIENCLRTRHLNNETNKVEVQNKCTAYPTHACTEEDFITDLQKEYFSKIRLGTVQCIKKDVLANNPPILQGLVSGNIYAYITIKFSACKNTTENNNQCASPEEINKGLLNGYYIVHISDSLAQLNNKGDIQDSIIKMQYTTFSISSSKTVFQSFRILKSSTNSGLVFNDIEENLFLVQQANRESSTNYNQDYILLNYIILDDKYTEYQRSYITLFTILSRIGGLWQLIFLILGFLNKSFIQNEMNINIANKIFRFEQNEDEALDVQRRYSNQGVAQSIKLSIDRLLNRESLKIPNKLFKIFLFSIGCGKSVIKQIHQANQKIQKKLDIVEIVSSLQQYEKLKEILLDEDQKILFELIPDPIISNQKSEKEIEIQTREQKALSQQLSTRSRFQEHKFEQICTSFNNVKARAGNQQCLNSRIIKQLDSDMVKLFEQNNQQYQNREDEIVEFGIRALSNQLIVQQLCDSRSSRSPSLSVSQESRAAQVLYKNTHN